MHNFTSLMWQVVKYYNYYDISIINIRLQEIATYIAFINKYVPLLLTDVIYSTIEVYKIGK